ncbi:acetyl-CoA carboxylase biotin carboxyl carrier protein subunit [Pseudomonadota bacterium]|nr:acetyl-CoA carboxylase biotin carboxyl carrier protein subunit [Alphaproteobacteria bacterium]MDC1355980.1 acetyl-CoA carboxylase biotin carboxyl carrier protein subunit [Pseudomonadota bacterium]
MNNKKKNDSYDVNLVQALSDIVNNDDLSELEYETDEFKIKIAKQSKEVFSQVQPIVSQAPKENFVTETNKTISTLDSFTSEHSGAVNSPMVGTAYSSSEPGKEPFIKINSSVEKGDTLLIIEAMKVMNSITAHKSGKVTFIGFEDNQPIEFNQLLIIIE